MDYVITQEDFDVNPLVTQLGIKVGDTISYTKAEGESIEEAPKEETPADESSEETAA